MKSPLPNLGAALRRFRELRGIKAKDLAADAGFSASYISEIENGRRALTRNSVDRIAKALGEETEVIEGELLRVFEKESLGEPIFINDDAAPYRVKPKVDPLLGLLLEEMDAGQLKDLAHRLVDQALEGDHSARTRVAQLMENLPAEKVR